MNSLPKLTQTMSRQNVRQSPPMLEGSSARRIIVAQPQPGLQQNQRFERDVISSPTARR